MESKEALNNIAIYSAIHNNLLDNSVKIISKDLDRLEKYDKAKELIKKKYVDVLEIVYISKAYVKELWVSVYNQNRRHPNELTQEEFKFILKMFK